MNLLATAYLSILGNTLSIIFVVLCISYIIVVGLIPYFHKRQLKNLVKNMLPENINDEFDFRIYEKKGSVYYSEISYNMRKMMENGEFVHEIIIPTYTTGRIDNMNQISTHRNGMKNGHVHIDIDEDTYKHLKDFKDLKIIELETEVCMLTATIKNKEVLDLLNKLIEKSESSLNSATWYKEFYTIPEIYDGKRIPTEEDKELFAEEIIADILNS